MYGICNYIFVFDMIFLLLFIRHFERKSIVANLKGE